MEKYNGTGETSVGISFLGLLAIVFITLKLIGIIHWSWWWVLLPLYGPMLAVVIIIGVLFLAALLVASIATALSGKRRRK